MVGVAPDNEAIAGIVDYMITQPNGERIAFQINSYGELPYLIDRTINQIDKVRRIFKFEKLYIIYFDKLTGVSC
ncbi:MAG: hypothetical protein GY927_00265 [bacterium]|nr:hypothetical protein [bacterium]